MTGRPLSGFLAALVLTVGLTPASSSAQSANLQERAQRLANQGAAHLAAADWVSACASFMLANAYGANAYRDFLDGILPLLSDKERSACIVQARVNPSNDPSFNAADVTPSASSSSVPSGMEAPEIPEVAQQPKAVEPPPPPPDPEAQIAACIEEKMRAPSDISPSIRRTMFELDCYVEVSGNQ